MIVFVFQPKLRIGVGERNFTRTATRILIENFRNDARFPEQVLEQLGFDQIGSGVEALH